MKSMKNSIRNLLAAFLALIMTVSIVTPMTVRAEEADEGSEEAITWVTDEYTFTKISNPTAGPREPDGINTNDVTGYEANRLNSYAWAVASRGNYIYIGTNRTLFGSALNGVMENLQAANPDLDPETVKKVITLISGGDVPVDLEEEDYIPQIIKFDIENGSTEVIYQPQTVVGEDGHLYYTDKDGQILPKADVPSETASFRSVIEFEGNLYFGSLGSNMLQLVRVDEEDNAEVVFQTIGLVSSLRACAKYDDGDGETVYFGGQDTTYNVWLKWRMEHPGEPYPLPIVIRRLDPATAGTDAEDWSQLVADYNDFGKYAYARVYANGGGNVWDLCDFNGKLYLVMAYDGGWALFRGEKGGENPNQFGWTWTEIVGDNGKYPLAMNEEVAALNEEYRQAYSCQEYAPTLNGAGLLESTATPYVFNGKMYIGSFDNATTIQSQTVIKGIKKIQGMMAGTDGPTLEQIYAPIYQVLSHPQHIWAVDTDENITAVDSANALLEGTTNDYVWRYIEYDGRFYTGTFDAATAYTYFVNGGFRGFMDLLPNGTKLSGYMASLLDGSFVTKLANLLADNPEAMANAVKMASFAAAFMQGDVDPDAMLEARIALDDTLADLEEDDDEAICMLEWLAGQFDTAGLEYWKQARELIKNADKGFDILVTDDGENWEQIVTNGCGDSYNYGARTFTICNDELYVGTANPYYGAQLWKIHEDKSEAILLCDPVEATDLVYTGEPQTLLLEAGEAEYGTVVYALGSAEEAPADDQYSEEFPEATDAGEYYIYYKVAGDQRHLDADGGMITVTIAKADPEFEVPAFDAIEGQMLSDLELPEGFVWDDAEQSVGPAGVNTFTATYTPEDTDNYNIVEGVEIKVNVIDIYTGFKDEYDTKCEFVRAEGTYYWYEDNVKQGTEDDPKGVKDTLYGGTVRGREIYDPLTDAWYWLDAVYDGAVAKDKEVWMPYVFQGDDNAEGKWVRYDKNGKMIKGWYANDAGTYYYDLITGAMLKGTHVINGKTYTFDLLTGLLQ